MKKFSILTLCFVISIFSYAQEFMGIKVDGSPTEIITSFKQKGFTLESTEGNNVIMIGKIGALDVILISIFTPTSKRCWKFAIFLPKQTSWSNLKSQYNEYVAMLSEKYGKPDKTYDFFSSPYSEGDGYEMTGVGVDKCNYLALWSEFYSIKIGTTARVIISYENPITSALDEKEKKQINQKSF